MSTLRKLVYPQRPLKLEDCIERGAGTELFVVEGDSAASIVCRVRDERYQAVLPMQGKPLNAIKATPKKVAANPWFAALTQALGTGLGEAFDLSQVRYERVVLLMDPDADGIHCGALVLMFFRRWMEPLLESGRVAMARAPMLTIHCNGEQFHVRSEWEYRAQLERLRKAGETTIETIRYRGLAGMDSAVLAPTCVHSATRVLSTLGIADTEAAMAVFGGGSIKN